MIIQILSNLIFQPMAATPILPLAVISAALASLAAVQGSIILMRQRNQAQRDRLRSENDYQLNLKAELEILYRLEKVDHLLQKQARMHSEIHEQMQRQIEILDEVQRGP